MALELIFENVWKLPIPNTTEHPTRGRQIMTLESKLSLLTPESFSEKFNHYCSKEYLRNLCQLFKLKYFTKSKPVYQAFTIDIC